MVVTVSPTEGERYYFRILLLNHITSPTCFDDLKIVNGSCAHTFRQTTLFRGLLKGDNNCQLC